MVNAKGGADPPGQVPFQPWAEAVYRERFDNFGIDDPSAYCIPGGVPRVNLIPYPFRIVNAPGRVVMLYEIYFLWREIFTDGRDLPVDPNPTWMGYSVGRWEADTFVVRSSGFNGKAWLDTEGRPTTDALQVTERFHRRDFGHMDLEMIVTDLKAYTRPWAIRVPLSFYADTEMLEYACAENNNTRCSARSSPDEPHSPRRAACSSPSRVIFTAPAIIGPSTADPQITQRPPLVPPPTR